jgi:hypothetical protein
MPVATVRIADLRQATQALERARAEGAEILLVSAAEVTAFAGVGYWHALEQGLDHTIVIDCGDDPGLAMAALRAGCSDLLFTGPEVLAVKLEGMAAQLGARVRRALDGA